MSSIINVLFSLFFICRPFDLIFKLKYFIFWVFSDRSMCQMGAVNAELVQVRAGGVSSKRFRMRSRKLVVGDATKDQRESWEKSHRCQRLTLFVKE